MNWIKLINSDKEFIRRGRVLRTPAVSPYEDFVDFMVFSSHDPERGEGLMISSGHKAGLILVILPKESYGSGNSAICRKWLIDNWSHWVYPESNVENVYLAHNYIANPIAKRNDQPHLS